MTREERIAEIRARIDYCERVDGSDTVLLDTQTVDFLLGELTVYEKALEKAAESVCFGFSDKPEETTTRWLSEARKEVEEK